jgi:hypothetical protein
MDIACHIDSMQNLLHASITKTIATKRHVQNPAVRDSNILDPFQATCQRDRSSLANVIVGKV